MSAEWTIWEQIENTLREIENATYGQVETFEAAAPTAAVLLALLVETSSGSLKRRIVETLYDLGAGSGSELTDECRGIVASGIWEYYRLMADPDPLLRDTALDMIEKYEPHPGRRKSALTEIAAKDPDERIRLRARRFLDGMFDPVFSWRMAELRQRYPGYY